MNQIRNKNSYEILVYDFTGEVYVICPNCDKKAIVKSEKFYDENVKVICTYCGFSKTPEKEYSGHSNIKNPNNLFKNIVVIGGGIDPYFQLPLWLSMYVGENLFWAHNYQHLNFIKAFVSAKLRERNIENMSNKSLGSRIPRWIASHKNRDLILKAIEKLEKK
ncbi:hypothetical protein [Chryseobacterium foetidum]|uniref:hypothetical protein n=1 Tax=Chryseobacterium foetidum TaxID=2951057 RepID=UPI0021C80155|nr:hypothetical protein [Chryseobacterium foetidum]